MFLRSSQIVTAQKTTIDINSTPFFVKHHGMKTYGEMKIQDERNVPLHL
jgi:hypothetical protein